MTQQPGIRATAQGWAQPLASERGFAMVGAILVMVLVTALGSAAIFLSQMDLTLAGNNRAQRTAEVAADGALELIKGMIYGNVPLLNLPLTIPTNGTAATWQQTAVYADADIDVAITIKYKQEDNINFNATETYVDEVVRYGKDYNFQAAQKDIGKQPVYTATFSEQKTGVKGEADLLTAIGFRTVAAIYVRGKIRMAKNPYANEELIEVVSGDDDGNPATPSPPAVATTKAKGAEERNVFIQRAVSLPDNSGTTRSYREQNDAFKGSAGTFSYYPDYRAEASLCVLTNPGAILTHPTPSAPYCPLTTLNSGIGAYAPPKQCWPDLYQRIYSDAEIAAEIAAGRYNEARDRMHVLLGVGERTADLNAAASYAASKAIFNFDVNDAAVVKYDYRFNGVVPTLEDLLGTTFADLRVLADQVVVGNQTVKDYNCSNMGGGRDLSGMVLGTAAVPQLVFFESNMNDDGTPNGQPELSLVTNGGSFQGYGILVINGDAVIYGSINWTGLMVVRGKLVFKPWQGGTGNFRSGPELSTRWNGFIMIGGDPNDSSNLDNYYGLHLWTYYGGSLRLGYSSSEAATIKGIIAATIPHKVLSWRRMYN